MPQFSHYIITGPQWLSGFCLHLSFSVFNSFSRLLLRTLKEHRKKTWDRMREEEKTWVLWSETRGHAPWLRGIPSSPLWRRLYGSRGQASWSVCLCLWARGERRWPCSAATWKGLSALMRHNYRARVFTRLRGSEEERERISTFHPACVYSPSLQILCFFFHSAIACLVALQTSATSKYRPYRLVTVTACHACFIRWDVELQTCVTCREVGSVVSHVFATWLGGFKNTSGDKFRNSE